MMNYYQTLILGFSILLFSCSEEGEETTSPILPQLSVLDLEVTESNTDQIILVSISRLGSSAGAVSVSYRTIAGTAENALDFVAVSQGDVTFADGETQKTVEITLKGDEDVEDTESFEVELFNPVGAALQRSKATITVKNDDITPFTIPSTGFVSPESYDGYTLVWSDEFQGASINKDDWTFEIGDGCPNLCGWGNNELEYYREENAYIAENEYLVIEAKQESFEGADYTSTRMITKDKQEYTFGRIDIRAVLPQGQGVWPALWMLGANIDQVSWPACGEIDIMEIIGSEPATLHGTVHWDNNGSYANFGGSTTLDNGVFADNFHVFSITWDSQFIRWYLDGVQYHIIDISPGALNEFRQDFFFIFNVAVGGNWPGSPDGTTVFPQRMIVDYIRVFQPE